MDNQAVQERYHLVAFAHQDVAQAVGQADYPESPHRVDEQ